MPTNLIDVSEPYKNWPWDPAPWDSFFLKKEMGQNLGKIPWAIKSNEMQKIILLGTACILRRFLSIERNIRLAHQEQPTNGPGSIRVQEAINSTNNNNDDK